MLNMTCAMTIVGMPRGTPNVMNRDRSEAPRTISGAEMFMNRTKSAADLPRNRYRTRARAINVPKAVAITVLMVATSSEFFRAAVRSGLSKTRGYQWAVNPSHLKLTFLNPELLKLYRIITRIGETRYSMTSPV